MTRHTAQIEPKSRPAIPTAQAARELGVSREHLSRVLHGHRQSVRLMGRYWKLVAVEPKQATGGKAS